MAVHYHNGKASAKCKTASGGQRAKKYTNNKERLIKKQEGTVKTACSPKLFFVTSPKTANTRYAVHSPQDDYLKRCISSVRLKASNRLAQHGEIRNKRPAGLNRLSTIRARGARALLVDGLDLCSYFGSNGVVIQVRRIRAKQCRA